MICEARIIGTVADLVRLGFLVELRDLAEEKYYMCGAVPPSTEQWRAMTDLAQVLLTWCSKGGEPIYLRDLLEVSRIETQGA